ncbi:hypothetical protein [Brevundimonas sp.]|uniref:hypothetical protein n=1 Tax=Brevundimonas sp. TaxID=1871086 RepID=UPI003569C804
MRALWFALAGVERAAEVAQEIPSSRAGRSPKSADDAKKTRTRAKARARLEALEAKLASLDTTHAETVSGLEAAMAKIEADRAKAGASYETQRKAIVADLRSARREA